MRVIGWLRRRPRSIASSTAFVTAAATLAMVALTAQGFPPTRVDLHDGGIWVTNAEAGLFSRYIKQIHQQDGGSATQGSKDFGVLQVGSQVLLDEHDKGDLRAIDPARVLVGAPISLKSRSAHVSMGGPDGAAVVAVVDQTSGDLWVRSFTDLGKLDLAKDRPSASLGAGGSAVVAVDGSVHAVSVERRSVLTFAAGDLTASPTEASLPSEMVSPATSGASAFTITAVGSQVVVLDSGAGRVMLPGGRTELLSSLGSSAVLQQPGPARGSVVLSTSAGLVRVPLASGSPSPFGPSVAQSGTVSPPAPVVVDGCSFGAFIEADRVVQVSGCDGEAPVASPLYGRSPSQLQSPGDIGRLVYRVNRGLLVLNDEINGGIWDPLDAKLVRLDDWQSAQQPSLDQPEQGTATVEPKCVKAKGANQAPVAHDDQAGARPSTPVVIDVLRNDSDPDCDVLALKATPVLADPSRGTVTLVGDGRQVQFTPATGVVGSVSFGYTVDDGRGGEATAKVTVTVATGDSNHKPVQSNKSTTVVVEGGSTTYAVLGDFTDPDGDPLQLVGTSVPGGQGVVRFSPAGVITYEDGGGSVGRVDIVLSVSDGIDTVQGHLGVEVRPRGDLPPTARPDYVRTTVGVPIDILPLANDSDPNGDMLRLASVSDPSPTGLTRRWDTATGRVTAHASTPGSYLLYYEAAAATGSTTGRIRVDVAAKSPNRAPSPMVDVAGVTVGGDVLVDVLANDIDPDGDVLAVTGTTVPDGAGLTASVDQNRFVRVHAIRALDAPVLVRYTVTDGLVAAQGTVVVSRVTASTASQPPVAQSDVARVRAGGAVTIQVLANDTASDGARLSLASNLVTAPTRGRAFVNGDTIRYLAGAAGEDRLTYRTTDSRGNAATGQVVVTVVPSAENNPPQPPPLVARVARGGTVTAPVPLSGIDPDGDPAMLTLVNPSAQFHNPVQIKDGTSLSYSAAGMTLGTDTVSYTVCDVAAHSMCADGVLRIAVFDPGVDQPPVAVPDSVVVRPGKRVAVAVLANDTDPEGDPIHFVADHPVDGPAGLALSVAGTAIVLTAPEADGEFPIAYRITDAGHVSEPVTGQLTVRVSSTAPLLAPVALDDVVTREQIQSTSTVTVDVLKNDSDADGTPDGLTLQLPAGVTAAHVQGRQLVVTLDPTRPQLIPYQVVDPDHLIGTAFVVVPAGGNRPPTTKPGLAPLTANAGKPLEIVLSQVAVDRDGPKPMTFVSSRQVSAAHGQVTVNGTTLTYLVAGDTQAADDTITANVTDGELTGQIRIPIVIKAANRPAVFAPLAETVEQADAKPHVYSIAANASDPDPEDRGKPITFETISNKAVQGLTLSLSAGGDLTVVVTPQAVVGTQVTFSFGLTDARGLVSPTKGNVVLDVVKTTKVPPAAVTDTVERLDQGQTVVKDVLANDVDPFKGEPNAGLALAPGSVRVLSGGVNAAASTGGVSITATKDFAGPAKIQYSIKDAAGRTADGVVDVMVWGVPTAPGTPTEVPGATTASSISLTWSASSANAFSADPDATTVHYEISYDGGSRTVSDNAAVITGLKPGTPYRFTIVAVNAVGRSAPSAPSATITPDALPSAPVFAPFTPASDGFDAGLVRLKWAQPAYDGTSITSYRLAVSPAAPGADVAISPGMTSKTVTGLTSGTAYQFTLCATNSKGETCSDPYSETPVGLPGAPGTVTATAIKDPAGGRIQASWSAATDGGDSSMVYDVRLYQGTTVVAQKLAVSGTSVELAGDTGTTYVVGVQAHNRKGIGPETKSGSVQSPAAPGPVTNLTATATGQNGVVQLAFTAPTDTGGAPIVGYEFTLNSITWSALAGNKQVTGLTNGTSYTIGVRANNGSYSGPSTNAAPVTPYGPPPAPTIRTSKPSATTVSFSWSAASNGLAIRVFTSLNGSTFTQVAGPGMTTYSGTVSAGNGYGQTYTLRVRSCDSNNTCVESSASATTDLRSVYAYNNYALSGNGVAVCRGNAGITNSYPGGTVHQTFTVPSNVRYVTTATVQITTDNTTETAKLFRNGALVGQTQVYEPGPDGDIVFGFGQIAVSPGDSMELRISFSATSGSIATVYIVGAPGGSFWVDNPCANASNYGPVSTGLRAQIAGMGT